MMLKFDYNSNGDVVVSRGQKTFSFDEALSKFSFDVGMDIVNLTADDQDRVIDAFDRNMWSQLEFEDQMSQL